MHKATAKKPAGLKAAKDASPVLPHPDEFVARHIGPRAADVPVMLQTLGYRSLEEFIDAVVPDEIRLKRQLQLPAARTEPQVLEALRALSEQNQVFRSYLGMGYADCLTP